MYILSIYILQITKFSKTKLKISKQKICAKFYRNVKNLTDYVIVMFQWKPYAVTTRVAGCGINGLTPRYISIDAL